MPMFHHFTFSGMRAIRFVPFHKEPLYLFLKEFPGHRPCNDAGDPVSPLCAWMIEKTGVYNLGTPLVRTPETWVIPRKMDFPTLKRSFIDHVFVRYPVPEFFYQVWENGSKLHKQWFAHLGSGKNIRTALGVPEGLYGKIPHYFLLAPRRMTLAQALVYGRVRGMGGHEKLAKAFALSPLGDQLEMDSKFERLIYLFIREEELTIPLIKPALAFFKKKYIIEQADDCPGGGDVFLARMKEDQYQEALKKEYAESNKTEFRAQICKQAITEIVVEGTIFQFTQIRNAMGLRMEGMLMKHCVGSYVNNCKRNFCSIWSVTIRYESANPDKRLTIEVLSDKRIDQVRGRHNRDATPLELKAVSAWATRFKLKKR